MKNKIIFTFLFLFSVVFGKDPYLTITVSQDGKGDYTTIQEAINSTRDLGPAEALIFIKNGTYHEKIVIPSNKHQLTLKGESSENTIITNDDFSGKIEEFTHQKMTTFTSYTVLVTGEKIKIENLSIQNTHCTKGQAVALHVEGDYFIGKNLRLLGCQDTLYTATNHSRQYYENCYIEGTTDFIFGQATAVFKNCTIKSLANSFITAAATDKDNSYGYVFFDCFLISKEGVNKVYLGRPWRPYAKTVFINTEMGKHILPQGWNEWAGDKMFPDKEKTAYYAEYESKGNGANSSDRVKWSHQLKKKELDKYTIEKIFRGWIPE
ncbi:pectinesterase [Chishuiella changwenlii]|uniref:Pectinesterase n=1 Tax=Chishuiella changwenlii TaxID=1434701 RepID=A0A1M7C4Z4_9FLAO|nr:pectinesterase family protein [Chishuiella changwenlii]GGF05697.1 pectinesterase [Chishuiella changwenlii]SHL61929.1 pectinesterase [Chishuiella changwenlii]